MNAQVNVTRLELVTGDITTQAVDAIVNAANTSLLGGGGVDGAIHRAAGPELLAETRALHGCKTGDAKWTNGYRLPARGVVHAVGPIYPQAGERAPLLLASAYRRSLEVAAEHGAKTVAFPSISTGVYGYPVSEAAPIALRTACAYARENSTLELIRFVLFDARTAAAYEHALTALAQDETQRIHLL